MSERKSRESVFENIDCIHLRVADLDEGMGLYRDALGLSLLWRTEKACGLGMTKDVTEIVLSAQDLLMVDVKVADVEQAVALFVAAGGSVNEGPFEIDVGKCAVVTDPWGNSYCLLDTSKGTYDTNQDGTVNGVSQKS